MHGVLVANMHFEVFLRSLVVRPHSFLPSTNQFIKQRLHVHAHFIPRVSRNYQRHEYVVFERYKNLTLFCESRHTLCVEI
jgi:hypothetical protein